MVGAGAGDLIFHSLCGKKKALDVGGPSSIDFIYFLGSNMKNNAMGEGGGARSAPVWGNNTLKKTGAHARQKPTSRLNMELDLQSLFGLPCTAVLIG
jgi:hypothetical protein